MMTVSEIEPIVVQAVECLFPDVRHHKYIFNILRERGGTRTRLALLKYCDKDSEKLRAASEQSHPHFWMDEISPIFKTMEEAEEWVRSISESHPNWDPETQTISSNNETNEYDEKTG